MQQYYSAAVIAYDLRVSGIQQHRVAFGKPRRHAISKAAEAHAKNLEGDSKRDALLMAMHYADGAERARLLAAAAQA